jgi:hypothetical protein
MPRLQFVGQAARKLRPGDLHLLNAYTEVIESKSGKTPIQLLGTPGLTRFISLAAAGGMRVLYTASNGRVFGIQGNVFFELLGNGTGVVRGVIASSFNPISMADNGISLMLVDHYEGWVFTFSTNVFLKITDPDFPGASKVDFLDGYFVFVHPGSQQFGWTNLLSTDLDALNFSSAEGSPDQLVTQLVMHREYWAIGKTSTEIFVPSGDPDAPFARVQGTFLHQGTTAINSVARLGETACWLSNTDQGQPIVVQVSGYNPQRVSTHPMETILQGYSTVDDAQAWGELWQGHWWYTLTFPTANATWRLDMSTGLWAQLGSLNPVTGAVDRYPASCFTFGFNRHIYGSHSTGAVYEARSDAYTFDGAVRRIEAILPPVYSPEDGNRVIHKSLQIDLRTGVGADGGSIPHSNPQLMLSWSNDGGESWSAERLMQVGRIGESRVRAKAYQLGMARDRRYKIAMTDGVRFELDNILIDIAPGVT